MPWQPKYGNTLKVEPVAQLEIAAAEIFQILQSFDYTVMLYDADGNRVADPADGRRFYAKAANLMVSLTDDEENSTIKLFIGKSTAVQQVLGLIDHLRTCAKKFNLLYNILRHGSEITPKTFAADQAIREQVERLTDRVMLR